MSDLFDDDGKVDRREVGRRVKSGAAVLLAGLGGFWALRRRKQNAMQDDEPVAPTFKTEPFKGNADTAMAHTEAPLSQVGRGVRDGRMA